MPSLSAANNILKRLQKLAHRYDAPILFKELCLSSLELPEDHVAVGTPPRDELVVPIFGPNGYRILMFWDSENVAQSYATLVWAAHELAHLIHHQGCDMKDEMRSGFFSLEYAIYREIGLAAGNLFQTYYFHEFPASGHIHPSLLEYAEGNGWKWHHSMRLREGLRRRDHDPLNAVRGGVKAYLVDQCYRRPTLMEKFRGQTPHPKQRTIVEMLDHMIREIPGKLQPVAERIAFTSPEFFYILADSDLSPTSKWDSINRGTQKAVGKYLLDRTMGWTAPYTFSWPGKPISE